MPTVYCEADFLDYLAARLHHVALSNGPPPPRVTDLAALLASGAPLGFSLGPLKTSAVSGQLAGYRPLVLHTTATGVAHSVYLVRGVTFTKPPRPRRACPNGRTQGVEYAEATLPLAVVGPLWQALRHRCSAARFARVQDQHTPRLRLWANWGVDGHPGMVVYG